jgi:hypothetical protein
MPTDANGLIHQKKLRLAGQCARDCDSLLHPA